MFRMIEVVARSTNILSAAQLDIQLENAFCEGREPRGSGTAADEINPTPRPMEQGAKFLRDQFKGFLQSRFLNAAEMFERIDRRSARLARNLDVSAPAPVIHKRAAVPFASIERNIRPYPAV